MFYMLLFCKSVWLVKPPVLFFFGGGGPFQANGGPPWAAAPPPLGEILATSLHAVAYHSMCKTSICLVITLLTLAWYGELWCLPPKGFAETWHDLCGILCASFGENKLIGSCQVTELWRHKRYSLRPIFRKIAQITLYKTWWINYFAIYNQTKCDEHSSNITGNVTATVTAQ